ncbi:MAG TPA: hypothetical protein VF126_18480 [Acidobacteriaceae bacterium]
MATRQAVAARASHDSDSRYRRPALAKNCRQVQLEKSCGETAPADATLLNKQRWEWPAR